MIKVEKRIIKNREYYYTYSDENKMIKDENDNLYIDAYDVVEKKYVETDKDISESVNEDE